MRTTSHSFKVASAAVLMGFNLAMSAPEEYKEDRTAPIIVRVDGSTGAVDPLDPSQENNVKVMVIGADGSDRPFQVLNPADLKRFHVLSDGEDRQVQVILNGKPVILGGQPSSAFSASGEIVLDVASSDSADPSSKAWLGVQLGELSDILAAQVGLEPDQGATVVNIVKDSPADRAGLKRFDIIVSVNGQKVTEGGTSVVKAIQGREPGEKIDLELLRNGKSVKVSLVLGERKQNFEWKFELVPQMTEEDAFSMKGRLIRPGEDGDWIIEPFDESDLENLPDVLKQYAPQGRNFVRRFWFDDEGHKIKIERDIDGQVLSIEEDETGRISVRRGDEHNAVTKKYSNREELRAGDEEAYDLLQRQGQGGARMLRGPGAMGRMYIHRENEEDDDDEDDGQDHEEFMVELEGQLQGAEEAIRRALRDLDDEWDADALHEHLRETIHESLERALESLHSREFPDEAKEALHEAMRKAFQDWDDSRLGDDEEKHFFRQPPIPPAPFNPLLSRPRHTFQIDEDGKIEVRIRKGDSELVRVFKDANDLQARAPELHEKYQNLMSEE